MSSICTHIATFRHKSAEQTSKSFKNSLDLLNTSVFIYLLEVIGGSGGETVKLRINHLPVIRGKGGK